MIEIRVICDPDEAGPITAALNKAFNLGPVRHYPARDGGKRRLYATADHLSPSPDLVEHERARTHPAYTNAPAQADEMDWLIQQANEGKRDREWWLRRAALTDRFHPDHQAEYIARALIALDRADVTGNPRDYVREQYAAWHEQTARQERTTNA
ncbi:hypothetical protein ACGF5O_38735 [Streptomyces sp. NPDC048291]|uniref:hypothetical protein n=1 Tax=Streptomyces sp. NPDC048291 TaxID=3365530 RepID=UPI003718D45E